MSREVADIKKLEEISHPGIKVYRIITIHGRDNTGGSVLTATIETVLRYREAGPRLKICFGIEMSTGPLGQGSRMPLTTITTYKVARIFISMFSSETANIAKALF